MGGRWWQEKPEERFWMEATDRIDIGGTFGLRTMMRVAARTGATPSFARPGRVTLSSTMTAASAR